MFWGRGSFYRTSFHIFISLLSAIILISGISSKLNIFGQPANGLGLNDTTLGSEDIFSQSGTSQSLVLLEGDQYDYMVYKYEVKRGDTLSSIAKQYNVSINTMIWANYLPNANAALTVGQVLKIPNVDGAFYKVKKGDTLDKVAKATKSTIPDIVDFNSKILDPENPVITEGMELFIVGGEIVAPVVNKPVYKNPVANIVNPPNGGGGVNIPRGTFINPLVNCPGYVWIRGFTSSHLGVDLAKGGGCWISSSAPGKVVKISWESKGGNYVVVDHGNGIKTAYYHGEKRFAVQIGDEVKAGQALMYMGRTGVTTGVHLHFVFIVNGRTVNPESYVKVR
jgi:murein DD-endopeptidase MepM/ murein hydrolase activator NlpD